MCHRPYNWEFLSRIVVVRRGCSRINGAETFACYAGTSPQRSRTRGGTLERKCAAERSGH